ncbi:TolC family protein [bacterium]|nr:TolC family protein [bacterium]
MRGHCLPGWAAECLGLIVNDIRHRRRSGFRALLWLGIGCSAVTPLHAQQDASAARQSAILEFPDLGPIPGGNASGVGPGPGALDAAADMGATTAGSGVLGGRQRTGRIPRSKKGRGMASVAAAIRGMQAPEPLPVPVAPEPTATTTVIDATIIDDPGPADGLTLDAAIERMMAANLDIRALRHELTQADADVLTAGLRTNPLIYMDTQFIPYGSFSNQRPGGPTQYDINITLPMDLSRKRQSRTVVARMARSTLEAQFQDVTRRQIDNVYRAFVSLQAARIGRLAAAATVRRHEERLAELARVPDRADGQAADAADHAGFVLERSRNDLDEAIEAYDDAREGLALLLNLPPEETARLEPSGGLRNASQPPPSGDELLAIALRCRPDLHAARLGVNRAGAELALQRANRFDDVYLFYDPITFQDNSPFNAPSASSWAVGLTFALPIFNRNQGNIARAESNIGQTKLEFSALERRAVAEVRLADREFHRSLEAIGQIERAILPRAEAVLARRHRQFAAGEITIDDLDGAVEDLAEVTQSHRDAVIRHRRAMLELNTAVGLRLLP